MHPPPPTLEFLDSGLKDTRTYDKENFLTFLNGDAGLIHLNMQASTESQSSNPSVQTTTSFSYVHKLPTGWWNGQSPSSWSISTASSEVPVAIQGLLSSLEGTPFKGGRFRKCHGPGGRVYIRTLDCFCCILSLDVIVSSCELLRHPCCHLTRSHLSTQSFIPRALGKCPWPALQHTLSSS